jgi:hypothetical protein
MKRLDVPEMRRVEISWTYSGLLEGSPESASPRILAALRRRFEGAPNSGKVLFAPESATLPKWRCIALIERPGGIGGQGDLSSLEMCWFVEDLETPVEKMVAECLERVSWNEQAQPLEWL